MPENCLIAGSNNKKRAEGVVICPPQKLVAVEWQPRLTFLEKITAVFFCAVALITFVASADTPSDNVANRNGISLETNYTAWRWFIPVAVAHHHLSEPSLQMEFDNYHN